MILAIFAVIWFILIHPAYALSPPILSEPPNNSVIYSGLKLSWQAVIDSTEYKIMIDDESSITSPYAKTPYYTKNTYYSPKLNTGSYYWKVGAKDSSGIWFWSDVWFFTLSTSIPSPTPTATPTPSSTTSSSSTTSTSSFAISNTPSQINSDQSFTTSVNLSLPNDPNTNFYLKGAFKKADSTNYFGLTKVSGNWIKNGSSYASQYLITTDSSGNWSGNLEVQPDSKDSGFTDTGDYIFKVGRYTSTGSGPTWSNESNIKITAVENADQGGISPDSSSSTTAPSSSPKSEQSAKSKTTSSSQSKSYDRLMYHSSTVAAATTSASPPNTAVKIQQPTNFIVWLGTGLILTGIGLLAYISSCLYILTKH